MKTFDDFFAQKEFRSTVWGGKTISVLFNPKLMMLDPENAESVDHLIEDLQIITAESFGTELETKSDDGVRNHVVNVDSIAFLHDHDKILGFASSKLFPEEKLFYLHGVATARSFKCKGVGNKLICTLMEAANLYRIAFTTQNPIMFCLLRSLCKKVYPNPESKEVPVNLKELGIKLISERPGKLDPRTFVITELYDRCLYDKIPDSNDKCVNQWFQTVLNVKNGLTRDGFLFIGEK